jgi:hypothetical protein
MAPAGSNQVKLFSIWDGRTTIYCTQISHFHLGWLPPFCSTFYLTRVQFLLCPWSEARVVKGVKISTNDRISASESRESCHDVNVLPKRRD